MKKYLFFLLVVVLLVGSCKSDFFTSLDTDFAIPESEIGSFIQVTGVDPKEDQGITIIGLKITHSYDNDLYIYGTLMIEASTPDGGTVVPDATFARSLYRESPNVIKKDGSYEFSFVAIVDLYLDTNKDKVRVTSANAKILQADNF